MRRINPQYVGLGVFLAFALFALFVAIPLTAALPANNSPYKVLFRLSDSDNHLSFNARDEAALRPGKQIFFHHRATNGSAVHITNPSPENRVFLVDWTDNQEHFVGPEGIDLTGTEYGILVYNGEKILVNRKLYIERH